VLDVVPSDAHALSWRDCAEFGVFRGGTARLLAAELLLEAGDPRALHLFDSLAGMPDNLTGEAFSGKKTRGLDFDQRSEAAVRKLSTPSASTPLQAGVSPIRFLSWRGFAARSAHFMLTCDQSLIDCVELAYPRLVAGGIHDLVTTWFPKLCRAREATIKRLFPAASTDLPADGLGHGLSFPDPDCIQKIARPLDANILRRRFRGRGVLSKSSGKAILIPGGEGHTR